MWFKDSITKRYSTIVQRRRAAKGRVGSPNLWARRKMAFRVN